MLGNITELKNPTRMMLHIAKCPNVSIEVVTSRHAIIAAIPSTFPGLTF